MATSTILCLARSLPRKPLTNTTSQALHVKDFGYKSWHSEILGFAWYLRKYETASIQRMPGTNPDICSSKNVQWKGDETLRVVRHGLFDHSLPRGVAEDPSQEAPHKLPLCFGGGGRVSSGFNMGQGSGRTFLRGTLCGSSSFFFLTLKPRVERYKSL